MRFEVPPSLSDDDRPFSISSIQTTQRRHQLGPPLASHADCARSDRDSGLNSAPKSRCRSGTPNKPAAATKQPATCHSPGRPTAACRVAAPGLWEDRSPRITPARISSQRLRLGIPGHLGKAGSFELVVEHTVRIEQLELRLHDRFQVNCDREHHRQKSRFWPVGAHPSWSTRTDC